MKQSDRLDNFEKVVSNEQSPFLDKLKKYNQMKLQDKLQELLYEQRSYRYTYFGNEKRLELTETDIKKAMIGFAAYCCERQRESDSEAANTIIDDTDNDLNPCAPYIKIDKSSILNNKLITD